MVRNLLTALSPAKSVKHVALVTGLDRTEDQSRGLIL
jgi:hypothetical protein